MTQPDDEAWRQIVENYGELPIPPVEPPEEAPEPFRLELYDEEFVPPPLPPPAVISPERRLAWVGLVGSPLALVVVNLLGYALPDVLTGALVLAFIASFGYLVATMDPRDPDDDGARV
ncbi:MAG: hypothetical protein WB797_08835 [Nocardioides sp.]